MIKKKNIFRKYCYDFGEAQNEKETSLQVPEHACFKFKRLLLVINNNFIRCFNIVNIT